MFSSEMPLSSTSSCSRGSLRLPVSSVESDWTTFSFEVTSAIVNMYGASDEAMRLGFSLYIRIGRPNIIPPALRRLEVFDDMLH
jgi:hypothetical protein